MAKIIIEIEDAPCGMTSITYNGDTEAEDGKVMTAAQLLFHTLDMMVEMAQTITPAKPEAVN